MRRHLPTLAIGLVAASLSAAPLGAAADPAIAHAATAPAATATATATVTATATAAAAWPMAGHDTSNDRNNPLERTLSASTVGGLQMAWKRPLSGQIGATPIVVNGIVYVSDFGGMLWAVRASTGAVVWKRTIASYTRLTGDFARASLAYANGVLFVGDHPSAVSNPDGAHLLAIKASNGALVWNHIVDSNPSAIITGGAAIRNGIVYVGVSSDEERRASCCTFRGSVVALRASNGSVVWRTYTAPAGYTGNSVWGSNPAIDPSAGLLYVGTGNNYSVPDGVCTMPQQTGCAPHAPNDYVDSLLALHLDTGQPAWSLDTLSDDVSSHVCLDPASCGPDFDFGSDPNMFNAPIGGTMRHLIGIGQKSGIYWVVDRVTGELVWQKQIGPGGTLGGIQWGSATDGHRIYVAESDAEHASYQLKSGATITGGSFAALRPNGTLAWQVADPQGARDVGFVSTANGVVYAGSDAGTGPNMFALDAATGATLWSFASGGAVIGGAAIVDGTVYWASGYRMTTCPPSQPSCGGTNALYAFRLPAG